MSLIKPIKKFKLVIYFYIQTNPAENNLNEWKVQIRRPEFAFCISVVHFFETQIIKVNKE